MKLLLLVPLFFLCAFKFNPMSQSLELDAGSKSVQFIAENETDQVMPIEFTVKERVMDKDGKETFPIAQNVTIFPPMVTIPPKEKRTIRVNWNGPSDIKSELAFRVIAEQLPLDVSAKPKASGIQMLMRYMAAFYVTPKNVEAKISSSIVSSETGKTVLSIKNSGTKHQLIVKPTLVINHDGKKTTLKNDDLKPLAGENVLAGIERHFTLKTKEIFPANSEVTLKIEE